jgi:hypothetical protein
MTPEETISDFCANLLTENSSRAMTQFKPGAQDPLVHFTRGYDGLILGFSVRYQSREHPATAAVELLCRESDEPLRWFNLAFRLDRVTEFRVEEGHSTCQALSDGAQVYWRDRSIVVDLDPGPNGLDEPNPNYKPRCFFVAEALEWDAVPYQGE